MTRAELARASGQVLDVAGRSMKVKRIRHDIGLAEPDDAYRARLLAELDRLGCGGLQLVGVGEHNHPCR